MRNLGTIDMAPQKLHGLTENMPRRIEPKWNTQSIFRIDVSDDLRSKISKVGKKFELPEEHFDELALDVARIKGWLSVDDKRPKRSEQAAALNLVSTSYHNLAQLLRNLRSNQSSQITDLIIQFDTPTILGPTEILFGIPLLLDHLKRSLSKSKSDPKNYEVSEACVSALILSKQLDDFSQSALFDELLQMKPPNSINDAGSLSTAMNVIATASASAAKILSKPGRARPIELFASVGYLLKRYETITGKRASYYSDDEGKVLSESGRFVVAMLQIAECSAQPTTISQAVEAYCAARNAKEE